MCLRIAPLPYPFSTLNPDWVLLIIIYWILSLPHKIGIFSAWTVGLFVDVLLGRMLGQYALIYAVIAYISLKLYKRLRQFPLLQQSIFICICLIFEHLMLFWIENLQSPIQISFTFWMPILTGTFFWPLIFPLLGFIRHLSNPN